jgi:predicted Zn-ribbon and HTH transcriptional regulator
MRMGFDRVDVEGELSSCPKCRAGGGFHVSFRRVERRLEVVLVCPSCGYRFAAGEFLIPDGSPRPFDPSIDSGP